MRTTCSLIAVFLHLIFCSRSHAISDFSSDGCSLFPDKNLITRKAWCECCFEHDIAYWKGGTEKERERADRKLKECVLEKTADPVLANTIYSGVRFGGSPFFYNWYRWGYGWNYGRGYTPLSSAEQKEVSEKLKSYFKANSEHPCR